MLKIYNSLSRRLEEFKPLDPPRVKMYSCGPTVYDYIHVGNWRTYTISDFLQRTLEYFDYQLTHIMNITDVGHLAGDNLGDPSVGEDRMQKASQREGRSSWEIANFYAQDFLQEFDSLNLREPQKFPRATQHIPEMIALIRRIEQAGYTYEIKEDGIYFDVQKYIDDGYSYGELSELTKRLEGARVQKIAGRKDPRDFALWKFHKKQGKREMEWDSPWGEGFPGWHIECSAMSIKYLGEQFDLHLGGEDLRSTHHPNEIVQSEAAGGKKPFVKYWVHVAFLRVEGGRMAKSKGNAYSLHDLRNRDFKPLDLRYFYLTTHYRKPQNFTWEALQGARKARLKLVEVYQTLKAGFSGQVSGQQEERSSKLPESALKFQDRFGAALSEDLNLPEALAVVWETVKSELSDEHKVKLLEKFDQVLGLDLSKQARELEEGVPPVVKELAKKRHRLRVAGNFEKADQLREEIAKHGYEIRDIEDDWRVFKAKGRF